MNCLRVLVCVMVFAIFTTNTMLAADSNISKYLEHPTGVYVNLSVVPALKVKQEREYAKYKRNKQARHNTIAKATSIEDEVKIWGQWMSAVEDQNPNQNCYAHAATGVVEGLLHKYNYLNSDINLNEDTIATSITNCPGHVIRIPGSEDESDTFYCSMSGGHPECAFKYIRDVRPACDSDDVFPNYDHAHYSLVSYSELDLSEYDLQSNIETIQEALDNSPVCAIYFVSTSQVFSNGILTGSIVDMDHFNSVHAVVIVGYNDEDEYWICRDSNGGNGVFKVHFGVALIDS